MSSKEVVRELLRRLFIGFIHHHDIGVSAQGYGNGQAGAQAGEEAEGERLRA
jgi:hypothetical protein